MNHTPQIKKAIQFAARKHQGQMRLEKEPLPYITHPVSVALLVAEDGAHDDVVTAALLHDTLEDTNTTREEIAETFNEHVAQLVESVTEVKQVDGKKLEWKDRKFFYLENLQKGSDEALLVSIGDKVDNIESKFEAYEKEGEELHKHWKQPVSEYSWFHGEVLRIAEARLPNHRLTKRLAELHAKEIEVFS